MQFYLAIFVILLRGFRGPKIVEVLQMYKFCLIFYNDCVDETFMLLVPHMAVIKVWHSHLIQLTKPSRRNSRLLAGSRDSLLLQTQGDPVAQI